MHINHIDPLGWRTRTDGGWRCTRGRVFCVQSIGGTDTSREHVLCAVGLLFAVSSVALHTNMSLALCGLSVRPLNTFTHTTHLLHAQHIYMHICTNAYTPFDDDKDAAAARKQMLGESYMLVKLGRKSFYRASKQLCAHADTHTHTLARTHAWGGGSEWNPCAMHWMCVHVIHVCILKVYLNALSIKSQVWCIKRILVIYCATLLNNLLVMCLFLLLIWKHTKYTNRHWTLHEIKYEMVFWLNH